MAEKGRGKSLLKNTAILFVGTLLPRLASIVTLPILTGYLTKEEYGTYDLVTVLVSLLLPAITLQIQAAAFRHLIDVRDDHQSKVRIISNTLFFSLSASLVALMLFAIFAEVGSLQSKVLMCIYFLVDMLFVESQQFARGLGELKRYSRAAVFNTVITLVLALVLIRVLRMGLVGCMIMLIASTTAGLLYIVISCRLLGYVSVRAIDPEEIRGLIAYSWPLVPNALSEWVIRLSNRLFITYYLGLAASATFAVAYKIPQILNLIQNPFVMAWQENASITIDDEDSPQYYSTMFRTLFDFLAGCVGLLLAFCPILFALFVRGDYDDTYRHIPVLMVAFLFQCLSGYLGGIFVALKQTKSVGMTTVAAGALNLMIDAVGIPMFGLSAAALGVLISYALLCIYRMYKLSVRASLTYNIPHIVFVCMLLAVLGSLCIMRQPTTSLIVGAGGLALFIALDWRILLTLSRMVLGQFVRR